MKSLRFLFALSILTTLFFTSCVEENQILEQPQSTDDAEMISTLFDSDQLIGIGEVKEGNKYSFTVLTDDLSQDLQDQLEGKEKWVLDNTMSISSDVMKRIWGEKIKDTEIENGFDIEAKEHIVTETYMTPDGESLTELVKDDPTILANARDVISYLYVEVGDIVDVETEEVVGSYIYVESCTIIIP